MTGPRFDPTIHAENRLRICAFLDVVKEAEFSAVRESLGTSDSVLSKHVTVLMEAGYVRQRRALRDGRQRVWLKLTGPGTAAYRGHVAALREILGGTAEEQ